MVGALNIAVGSELSEVAAGSSAMPEAASLQGLPDEIISKITAYLDVQDLKNVRLSCQVFDRCSGLSSMVDYPHAFNKKTGKLSILQFLTDDQLAKLELGEIKSCTLYIENWSPELTKLAERHPRCQFTIFTSPINIPTFRDGDRSQSISGKGIFHKDYAPLSFINGLSNNVGTSTVPEHIEFSYFNRPDMPNWSNENVLTYMSRNLFENRDKQRDPIVFYILHNVLKPSQLINLEECQLLNIVLALYKIPQHQLTVNNVHKIWRFLTIHSAPVCRENSTPNGRIIPPTYGFFEQPERMVDYANNFLWCYGVLMRSHIPMGRLRCNSSLQESRQLDWASRISEVLEQFRSQPIGLVTRFIRDASAHPVITDNRRFGDPFFSCCQSLGLKYTLWLTIRTILDLQGPDHRYAQIFNVLNPIINDPANLMSYIDSHHSELCRSIFDNLITPDKWEKLTLAHRHQEYFRRLDLMGMGRQTYWRGTPEFDNAPRSVTDEQVQEFKANYQNHLAEIGSYIFSSNVIFRIHAQYPDQLTQALTGFINHHTENSLGSVGLPPPAKRVRRV